jgi:hypothetical protein
VLLGLWARELHSFSQFSKKILLSARSYEDYRLLGCDALMYGRNLRTFPEDRLLSSLKYKNACAIISGYVFSFISKLKIFAPNFPECSPDFLLWVQQQALLNLSPYAMQFIFRHQQPLL